MLQKSRVVETDSVWTENLKYLLFGSLQKFDGKKINYRDRKERRKHKIVTQSERKGGRHTRHKQKRVWGH